MLGKDQFSIELKLDGNWGDAVFGGGKNNVFDMEIYLITEYLVLQQEDYNEIYFKQGLYLERRDKF